MRLTVIAAIAGGVALLAAAAPAEAAKKRGARTAEAPVVAQQEARPSPRAARAPARITVRRPRSFLDPGTEVLPLSQPYTNYAVPPMHAASDMWDPSRSRRFPLPEPYYLPGLGGNGF
ncbi:MAG: hypothetical protein IRZ09_13760 [Variibacter sp.]|nr:hypothetical protein [Variibacter sp.]